MYICIEFSHLCQSSDTGTHFKFKSVGNYQNIEKSSWYSDNIVKINLSDIQIEVPIKLKSKRLAERKRIQVVQFYNCFKMPAS